MTYFISYDKLLLCAVIGLAHLLFILQRLPPWIVFFLGRSCIGYFFFFNQSSILYTSVYTCQSQSPNSAHHHPHPTVVFPPWCPYVCSLHLCLNFCPANQFICLLGSWWQCREVEFIAAISTPRKLRAFGFLNSKFMLCSELPPFP